MCLCGHTTSVYGVYRPHRYASLTIDALSRADVQMQCKWLGERVAAPSLRQVVRNALTKETAGNWGPNAVFKFPARDGTGGIWTAMARTIPPKKMRLGEHGAVERIEAGKKVAVLQNGQRVRYKNLISTMAVDGLLGCMGQEEGVEGMQTAARQGLVYSSTIILGLGIRGTRPDRIGDKCEYSRVLKVEVELTGRLAILPRGRLAILPRHHILQLFSLQHPFLIRLPSHTPAR